jgi:hypothetical protein
LGIVFFGSKTSCLSLGDDGIGLGDDRDRIEGWGQQDYVGDIGKKKFRQGGRG